MIPGGYTLVLADREERLAYEEECYKNAKKAYVNARDTLNSNIPFISDDMYNKYVELLSLTRLQFYEYEDRFLVTDLRPKEEKEQFSHDAYKRTREINEKWKALNRNIREYISKLDVMEDR